MPSQPESLEVAQSKVGIVIKLRNAGQSWDDIAEKTHWAWQKCRTVYTGYELGLAENKKEIPVIEQSTEEVMEVAAPTAPREMVLGDRVLADDVYRITASMLYDMHFCDYVALAENHLELESPPAMYYQRRSFVLSNYEATNLRDFLNAHYPHKEPSDRL